ncbi:MAG TPA: hypothetical protein VN889_02410 [Solirubrobacteraceae bacterium]|nr:hypothetical protein [Solirubrobacteraceae bacterium]
MPYSARGKTPDEILADFESGLIAEQFGGNTAEYMQAALTASAATVQAQSEATQRHLTKIAVWSGCVGSLAAVAAVIVAAFH